MTDERSSGATLAGGADETAERKPDLVCLSHLRWDFVFQRPQHLLSRCARDRRVFFVEEPIFTDGSSVRLEIGEILRRKKPGYSENQCIGLLGL